MTTHDLKFDKELNHFYLNSIDTDNDEDGNELVVSEYQYACPSLIPSRSSWTITGCCRSITHCRWRNNPLDWSDEHCWLQFLALCQLPFTLPIGPWFLIHTKDSMTSCTSLFKEEENGVSSKTANIQIVWFLLVDPYVCVEVRGVNKPSQILTWRELKEY